MFMFILSLITYLLFSMYLYFFLKTYVFVSKWRILIISCLCSLPAFRLHSILFIFEVHILVFLTIVRCILYFTKINKKARLIFCIVFSFILSGLCIGYGYYNAKNIVKTEYYLNTDKNVPKNYKIAFLSDLHYPTSMTKKDAIELVKRINKERCDVVILGGDIVDEHTTVKEREEIFQILGELNQISKVVYVYGNHDLGKYSLNNKISSQDFEHIVEENGIEVLKDEVLELDGHVALIGRDDFYNKTRLDIDELLKKCSQEDYRIVLDHQPKELEENADMSIDLYLSGHTHAGQIFPMYTMFEMFNINELNYGIENYKHMYAINTSGAGTWGFPIRTQNHSEYVILHIQ